MSKKAKFDMALESTRCGRCATLLPEETMHFCPFCSTPFSIIPPTNSFMEFKHHKMTIQGKRNQKRTVLLSFSLVFLFWITLGTVLHFKNRYDIHRIAIDRKVKIYSYDVDGHAKADPIVTRLAFGIALQSFEDHFGDSLKNVEIFANQTPNNFIKRKLETTEVQTLSSWEKVFQIYERYWNEDTSSPLNVILTNVPIYKDSGSQKEMETRHLGPEGMISGLGHPALVIVTSHRLLKNLADNANGYSHLSQTDMARHVGEYLLVHELGHALYGLKDFVLENHTKPIRSMASAKHLDLNPLQQSCIMHTDSGGGYNAWAQIKNRILGRPSPCKAYEPVIEAHRLRKKAFLLLKLGHRQQGYSYFEKALNLARTNMDSAYYKRWLSEKHFFKNTFEYWFSI